ncbi:cytochrome P450 [Leucogyrophana mollusca]|uniref:Cytochrome P450 n=1 Tax=Leucogyrophana mollusca TaxID=85980 RepID=A0ACB8BWB1_9AGAM|nr:cytochrome P450 [Leucogyrophana mollusca]
MTDFSIALSAIVSVTVVILLARRSAQKSANLSGLPLPPGPPRLPLLGNLFDINPSKPWSTYSDWGVKYGDIVYSSLLGQEYIIINSAKVAKALLERRSSIYSDRMSSTLYDLFGVGFSTPVLGYTDKFKLHRKLFHLTLRAEATTTYRDLYVRKARELVLDMLDDSKGSPVPMNTHFMHFSAAVIMAVAYGYEVTSRDDPLVTRVRQLMGILEKELPTERAILLTAFPLLRHLPAWFPGFAFKKQTSYCQKLADDVREIPFNYVKTQMAAGTAARSMVFDFLQSHQEDDTDDNLEQAMKDTAATVFLGGADTTSSALFTFVLAMVLYPEVQERAQAEIDALVGSDRLPDFEHRAFLPYVEAILRETLRWHPVLPLGVPHVTSSSDTYNGYYIPKGAIMVYNVWEMSHSSSDPEDTACFNPDRHLLPNGQLAPNDPISASPSFGFGRRICPGRFFAEGSMWAAVVTMLATLRFTKALDKNGKEIEVKPEFTTGLIIHPIPFQSHIRSRSAEREKEIRMYMEST